MSKPGDPMSKLGCKSLHPTNVGVPDDGKKTVVSGVPHVEKTS